MEEGEDGLKIFKDYVALKKSISDIANAIKADENNTALEIGKAKLKELEFEIKEHLSKSQMSTIGVEGYNFSFTHDKVVQVSNVDLFKKFVCEGDGFNLLKLEVHSTSVLDYIEERSLSEEDLEKRGLMLVGYKKLSVRKGK